jgi:hypothetical protein
MIISERTTASRTSVRRQFGNGEGPIFRPLKNLSAATSKPENHSVDCE